MKNNSQKQYILYVLELEDHKYYVGVTSNMKLRYINHKRGAGANYTKIHKPLRIYDETYLGDMTYDQAQIYENARTIEIISRIGIDKVRGGKYFQANIKNKTLRHDYKLIPELYKLTSKKLPSKIRKGKRKRADPWARQMSVAKQELKISAKSFTC